MVAPLSEPSIEAGFHSAAGVVDEAMAIIDDATARRERCEAARAQVMRCMPQVAELRTEPAALVEPEVQPPLESDTEQATTLHAERSAYTGLICRYGERKIYQGHEDKPFNDVGSAFVLAVSLLTRR